MRTHETRASQTPLAANEEGNTLIGHAALFNSVTDIGAFREQIAPGAFTEAIANKQDVRFLLNHDANHVLGRTTSGTLVLSEDEKGLRFELTLPNTTTAADLKESIRRGDISQCSFGFVATDDAWEFRDGKDLRTIRKADLFDVSAVTFPAYQDTTVSVRDSLSAAIEARRANRIHLLKARITLAEQALHPFGKRFLAAPKQERNIMHKKIAELKQLRSAKANEARALVNKVEAENRDMNPDELASFRALEADVKGLGDRIDRLEQVDTLAPEANSASTSTEARAAIPVATNVTAPMTEERAAFRHYLKTGEARTAVLTSNAGAMIPTFVADSVMQEVADQTFMRQISRVMDIAGDTKVPVISAVGNFAAVPEGGNYPELATTVGGPTLGNLKIGGVIPISYEMLNTGGFDVENEISTAIADGLAEAEEELFMVGKTASGEPNGVFSAVSTFVSVAKDTLTAQDLINLKYKVPQRYRNRGVYVMHPETLAFCRGLKDTNGQLIFQAGLTDDADTILGRPVYTSEHAPKMGANKVSVVFGDFSKYVIGQRKALWVLPLRELYSGSGKIGLQITSFVDANVAVPKAFAAFKHAAS